ncbi:MAG: hypothetical protein WEC37_03535 [Anaerolineales bacterium]
MPKETDKDNRDLIDKAAEELRADRDDALGYSREQFEFKPKKKKASKKKAKKKK